ncbi:MAG: amino acid adenylation domain-containing protein [Ectothiorhodospiraceae bacterium]|nr:amino acid adenylation domain-containing protein [Ectothiorhodospiraceae bacterium]
MDIAIVGIGCRFPGGANSPEAFWTLLRNGEDAVTELPADRFDLHELFDSDPAATGKIYTRWGGFLDQVEEFDADFFGIAPREARRMDPQQRVLLEVVWEALENGGQVPDRLSGSNTGVFVGISTHDYVDIQVLPHNRHRIDAHVNAGTAACISANRVSYLLDLRGPSFSVDTACSSSLTAVHLACRSLDAGECNLAIAGGVGVLLAPEVTMGFCKASMLSPNGRCRAFDAGADGYVRSEGAGVVILKPLAQALADADPIHAVIRGTAVNQDGRTTGLSLPSATAQADMLRQALRHAGVAPGDVQYVEAHGTGTPAGDPVEAEAIGRVLGTDRGDLGHCLLGSVKTNLGHLEAAAGMAGLIKATLALEHRQIPPNLHFAEPNPEIPFDTLGLRVPTQLEPWPDTNGRALAGVNSFGFGGANAHVVLEAPPTPSVPHPATDPDREQILTISAHTPNALRESVHRYREHLQGNGAETLHDVCYTAARRRSHRAERLAVVARSTEETIAGLDAFLAGENRPAYAVGHALKGHAPRLAFVFPGMGPQWWGMGRQLTEQEPVFRRSLEEVDALLQPLAGWSLLEELSRDEQTSRIADADRAHVANFAIQVALAALLRSWGVVPDALVGHSSGEMAAACVSGALMLPDAVLLAYHRGRLQHRTTGSGRMLAAQLSADEAPHVMAGHEHTLSLAAINGPESVTFSGTEAALEHVARVLAEQQRFGRFLPVQVPYHGPQMELIREELLDALGGLEPQAPEIPLVSTATGDWADGVPLDAGYWWRNVRQPVQFAGAVRRLIEDGCELFVELGPHPVLAGALTENLAEHGRDAATVLPSLRRSDDERLTMLRSLAAMHVRGRPVDWSSLYPAGRCVTLPAYPWQRERHWYDMGEDSKQLRPRLAGIETGHPLLGRRLPSAQPSWEVTLDAPKSGYLDAHVIHGAVLFPGAGYIEMALAAGRELWGDVPVSLTDVQFSKLLFLNHPGEDLVQFHYQARDSVVEIHGSPPDDSVSWNLHASARLSPHKTTSSAAPDLQTLKTRCTTPFPAQDHYDFLEQRSYRFGAAFRTLQEIWVGPDGALARIGFPPDVNLPVDPYRIHPALLDGTIQLFGALGTRTGARTQTDAAFFPVSVRRLTFFHSPGAHFWAHVVIRHGKEGRVDDMEGDAWLMDENGDLAVALEGLRLRVLEEEQASGPPGIDDWLYEWRWEERRSGAAPGDHVAPLRSVAEIAAAIAADHGPPEALPDVARYLDTVEPWVNRVARGYTLAALDELGWIPDRDLALPTDTVADSLGVVPRHRRLFAALLTLAQEPDETGHGGPEPVSRDRATLHGLMDELMGTEPKYAAEAELLRRGGTHLAAILRGELDAREVLLTEDALELLARFYTRSPPCSTYHQLLADAVAAAVESKDDAAPLRVLEIGAGTGAATETILPLLPDSAEYTFTDVSPHFLDEARARFGDRPGMRFTTLDIEADPANQGFQPGSFDLVIAANVLHVTADLRTTLAHTRQLLVANGLLAMLELTRRSVWLNLVFGLLDGWWRYTDVDLRAGGPMLEQQQWRSLLEATGFEDVRCLLDDPPDNRRLQAVVLAQAPAEAETPLPAAGHETRRHWLVFTDHTAPTPGIIEALEARGDRCTPVCPGDTYRQQEDGSFIIPPLDTAAYARMLEALREDGIHGVLHLWSLNNGPSDDLDAAAVMDAQRLGCGSVLALMQAEDAAGIRIGELCLVTAGAQAVEGHDAAPHITQSPLWGLGRVLMSEHDASRCRLIDLAPTVSVEETQALATELSAGDPEEEVALRGRARFVRRLRRVTLAEHARPEAVHPVRPDAGGFRLEVGTPGAIESLLLREIPVAEPGPGELAIQVVASGVNFRDVLQALDMLPAAAYQYDPDPQGLGIECAGVVLACGEGIQRFQAGDEVITLAAAAHGASVIAREHLTVAKPGCLSFAEAASVLNGFVTAEYALNHVARITAGERVLIQSATGAVGLAAIQLCQRVGAQVFATAGTPEKRAHLRELGVEHVMDSRSLAFAEEILRDTDGEGVDVVLNALSGEAMLKGLDVLRPYGRFIELGKRDIFGNAQLGLLPFQRNLSFHAVDLIPLALDRPALATQLLEHVVSRIAEGSLQPVPVTAFDLAEAEQGFRLMAQARHIGKVVLTVKEQAYPVHARPDASPVRQDGTYLITGGLGGFGLTVAAWLGRQGAGNIVLMSRSGIPQDNEAALEALRASSCQVTLVQGDVSDAADIQRVVELIRNKLPPLRGVIHAAMVLDDDVLVRLDQERFHRVLAPKVAGAWNLHQLTSAEDLDFFVLFSSIAAVLGHPMQGNYAAANAFLDALAAHRRARGLPALTIAWGALADVGYVSRHDELAQYLARAGFRPFLAEQALDTLNQLLHHDFDHVIAAGMDWTAWTAFNPLAAGSRRFEAMAGTAGTESPGEAGENPDSPLGSLRHAAPSERSGILTDYLVHKVARVLGTTPQKVDPARPFTELGFDSLMAVELGAAVKVDLGIKVPVVAILQGSSSAELAEKLLEQLALDTSGDAGAPTEPTVAAEPTVDHPLSFEQQRFWYLDRLHPGNAAYNIAVATRLSGGLDVSALERSLTELLHRHALLRAEIHEVDGTPMQCFAPPQPATLPVVDLAMQPAAERETALNQLLTEEIQRPFDLGQGPMMRVTLFRLDEQEHVILLIVHHIAADAWAMNLLVREMAVLYEAFSRDLPSPLSPPPTSYLDHIQQQSQSDQGVADAQLAYWKRQLADAPPGLGIPSAASSTGRGAVLGGHRRFTLSRDLSAALRTFSQGEGVTLFMTLMAAFQTLLHRYSGDEDICVATAASSRSQPGNEAVVGCFMNTLVLRCDLSGGPSFRTLLQQVKQTALEAFTHQDVPFDRVVEALKPQRDGGRNPLFQAMLVLHNARVPELRVAGLDLRPVDVESGTAATDLMLLLDDGEQISGTLEYNAERFDGATMEWMIEHLRNLLQAALSDPDQAISALPLYTGDQRDQVIVRWNVTDIEFGGETCLQRLIEAQVDRSPNAPAVVCGTHELSYRELDHRANQLAHHLVNLGVGQHRPVAVCLHHSPETVIAALAVLKARGVYLPLDPSHPATRLTAMLADAGPPALITRGPLPQGLAAGNATVVDLGDQALIANQSAERPAGESGADDPAYMIFTSGSTGAPKGVMVPHRAICNQVRWRQHAFPLNGTDAVLLRTPPGFDPSVWELFGPLSAGARLVVPPPEAEREGTLLLRLIREHRVTVLQVVPAVLDTLLELPDIAHCGHLQHVFCGGEPLSTALQNRCLSKLPAALHQLYGPTETTIDATYWTCRRDDSTTPVPIGRPIANSRVYVLDARLQPVPVGAPGELYIGGTGLAHGYLNQPDLTAERFIPNPFLPGQRIYRTGDRVYWRPDGTLVFIGRTDRQLKIRGQRVEPEEIEGVLMGFPVVREAVVIPRSAACGDLRLEAFVAAPGSVTAEELQQYTADRLPPYMTPTHVTVLDALPRTERGKLDRARLTGHTPPARTKPQVAPRDAVELELQRIWEAFFPGRGIGVTDDFFALGGHSLMAMRVIARMQQSFARDIPVSTLIEGRTIERLACLLRAPGNATPTPVVTIQSRGSGQPFFWMHPVTGTVYCYVELARALGEHHPVYALQAAGLIGDTPDQRIEAMADRYIEALRRIQPEGPYLLGGWSMGGVIAFEMARQLEKRGAEVSLLALLDAPASISRESDKGDGRPDVLISFIQHLGLSPDDLSVSPEAFRQLDLNAQLRTVLDLVRGSGLVPPDLGLADLQRQLDVFINNLRAMHGYTPRPYGGAITLLTAEQSRASAIGNGPGWEALARGGVSRHIIPGNHHTMLHPPNVAAVARQLAACLERLNLVTT